jgi:hypothetical protein
VKSVIGCCEFDNLIPNESLFRNMSNLINAVLKRSQRMGEKEKERNENVV